MIRLFADFLPANVFAGITDRTINFERPPQGGLADSQKRFLSDLNIDLSKIVQIKQVHGKRIILACQPKAEIEEADGLVTNHWDIPLMIRVADCLPVFLYDTRQKVIGLVHAGWRGTKEQIALEALTVMQEKCGSNIKEVKAGLGPSIRSCCYQVTKEFKGIFPSETIEKNQVLFFDLPQANKNQLLAAGIPKEHICDSEVCTCCDQSFFSYRREGERAGRMLALFKMS